MSDTKERMDVKHYAWCPTGMERVNAGAMSLMHFVDASDYDELVAMQISLKASFAEMAKQRDTLISRLSVLEGALRELRELLFEAYDQIDIGTQYSDELDDERRALKGRINIALASVQS